MSMIGTLRPKWLTFDCYGTLIQWDEGLIAAVSEILARNSITRIDPAAFLAVFDRHEHRLEQQRPHRSFRDVSAEALRLAMDELNLNYASGDEDVLLSRISRMPPFPEVVAALGSLKEQGFRLCIVSNTDDDIIAGNVEQLGGYIDRVVTAEQAQAYKPSREIFAYAHSKLGVDKDEIVHICASPHLDHAAARDIGFRCIWIDRGAGRTLLPDYMPDAIFPTLDRVPKFFDEIGWARAN